MPSMVTLNVKLDCPLDVRRRIHDRVEAALKKQGYIVDRPPIEQPQTAWERILNDPQLDALTED